MPLSTKDFILLLLSSVLVSSDASSSRKKLRTNKNEDEAVDVNGDEAAVIEGDRERNEKPMELKWSFWYENKSQNERRSLNKTDYLNHINKAGTFETVEGFWNCWNEVQLSFPSNGDCNYLVFQQGINPVWEDPRNSKGGKCFVVVPRTSHEDTTKQWVTLLLTMFIGEFDAEINGAVLSSRSWGNMFAVWTRVSDKHVVDTVCSKLQDIFGSDAHVKFQKHQIMMRKKFNKPRGGGHTSPEHHEHSDEEEHGKVYHQQPRHRSVVTTETKGVLHNLIAEMREAQPEYAQSEPAKEVPAKPSETFPGSAGQAAVTQPLASKEKKRRRSTGSIETKTERPIEFDLQKGLSTVQKIGVGVLLLAGGVATSALSWIYL
jgi:hypothetical protein